MVMSGHGLKEPSRDAPVAQVDVENGEMEESDRLRFSDIACP